MRLKSFHVRLFRNIVDSGVVTVAENTCIVGKNEAGKSSLVEALDRLNPARAVSFKLLDDYPRWLKKEHEIAGKISDAIPISAEFLLTEAEVVALSGKFGEGILPSKSVIAFRKYSGDLQLQLTIDEACFVQWFRAQHVDRQTLGAHLDEVKNVEDLRKTLASLAAERLEDGSLGPTAASAVTATGKLNLILPGAGGLLMEVTAHLLPLIPKTFYFSSYSQLRGRYNLESEVIPAIKNPAPSEDVQAAADFLKLANVTAENVHSWDYEQSTSELEAVSSLLTRKVKENWKQNPHLKLVVKIETERPSGGTAQRYLQFRVEDTRHDFSNPLDRRSTGFRWFVSFMASFFDFNRNSDIILLLDEPGLSLHARAQKDLLDAIDSNFTGPRQVIYTTHSPFMVRTESLDRVRIVEDKGPAEGAVVSNEAGKTSDPDTLFPLQAALGYDIAQNLFIGNRNILMEGTSDFAYLTAFSSYLRSKGRVYFPTNCRLLPAGGVTNIPTFIALIGGKLDIVVLIDGKASRQRIDEAIAQRRLNGGRVLSVDQFCTVKGADIEDLFAPSEYLAIYNSAMETSLKESELTGNGRIVKRIERATGEFDHGRVAAHFLFKQLEFLSTISPETLQRFESTIKALIDALPPERGAS